MKGIVFNLLEEVVTREYGEDTWDALLDAAGLDPAYTSLGSYADGEMVALVGAASRLLDLPADAVLRWFGRHAIGLLAERYPALFAPHRSTRAFVLTLNDIIHPEVRKIYPGADAPEFSFDARSPDFVVIEYRSARRMCAFALGMIEGAAARFGEDATLEQTACLHRGDASCVFHASFVRQAQAA